MKKQFLLLLLCFFSLGAFSQVSTTLTGTASTDPDGTISAYQWRQITGPATVSLSTPTSVTSGVSFTVAGTYSFGLVVTDNAGAKSFEDTVVIVVKAANIRPHADAGADQTLQIPGTAMLDNPESNSAVFFESGSLPAAYVVNETKPVKKG